MVRNENVRNSVDEIKGGRYTSDHMNIIEQYIEHLERENFGLRKSNENLREKEEKRYGPSERTRPRYF